MFGVDNYAFADAFDAAYKIRHDIKRMTEKKL